VKIWNNNDVNQPVRLMVSAKAYQPANSVFLSQQTSTSWAYHPRNQPCKDVLILLCTFIHDRVFFNFNFPKSKILK